MWSGRIGCLDYVGAAVPIAASLIDPTGKKGYEQQLLRAHPEEDAIA